MKMWRCTVCGLLYEGENPPESCPKCGAPAEKFELVSEEQIGVIEHARKTNQLHSDLLAELAKLLRQFSVAEVRVHVNKNKWG